MFNELLGKIKNKPGEIPMTQQPSSSDHVPDRVDILMEQVKNLIEINKSLNGKVRMMEDQLKSSAQSVASLQEQIQAQSQRAQKFEQIIVKCTQVIQKLQAPGGSPATVSSAPPAPQPVPQTQQPAYPQSFSSPAQMPQAPSPFSGQFVVDDLLANAPLPPQQFAAPIQSSAPAPVAQTPQGAKEAAPGNYFVLRDGRTLRSLHELKGAVLTMQEDEFRSYVNDYKNDIASWVRYCLDNAPLAGELAKAKTKLDVLRALHSAA